MEIKVMQFKKYYVSALLLCISFETTTSDNFSIKNRLLRAFSKMQQTAIDYSSTLKQSWSNLHPKYQYATLGGVALLLTAAAAYALRSKQTSPEISPLIEMERYEPLLSPDEISQKTKMLEDTTNNYPGELLNKIEAEILKKLKNKPTLVSFKAYLENIQSKIITDKASTLKELLKYKNSESLNRLNTIEQNQNQTLDIVNQLLDLTRRLILLHGLYEKKQTKDTVSNTVFDTVIKDVKEEFKKINDKLLYFKLRIDIQIFIKELLKANEDVKESLADQNKVSDYIGSLQKVEYFLKNNRKRLSSLSLDENSYNALNNAHKVIADVIEESLGLANKRNLLYQIKDQLIKEHGAALFNTQSNKLKSELSSITGNLEKLLSNSYIPFRAEAPFEGFSYLL